MLITRAEIWQHQAGLMDIRCQNGLVTDIAPKLQPLPGETAVDANGGALLPGMHDHHIHLLALAAAESSVVCGPPQVSNLAELTDALRRPNGDGGYESRKGWLRGIGYHESVAGELGREQLDAIVSHRPLRIQHRTGQLWMFNTAAMTLLGLEEDRLFRQDDWLRERIGVDGPPSLAAISGKLASFGITAITDASPGNNAETLLHFTQAIEKGELLQRMTLLGDTTLSSSHHRFITTGAVKLTLDEARLPEFNAFTTAIIEAHKQQRPVAIHAVTRTELVFALAALQEAGTFTGEPGGDRIEHASVTPAELLPQIKALGLTVVTQPGFVLERGDQYLTDVETQDIPHLYRLGSFLQQGIPLFGSSDAPYGNPDPWQAMRAAVNRETASGKPIGKSERLSPEQAVALFLSSAIRVGAAADFCLLDRPWASARTRLLSGDVVATICNGRVIYREY